MAQKWQYDPIKEFPHVPRDVAAQRLQERSQAADGGCRLWLGLRDHKGKGVGILSALRPNDAKRLQLYTNKLAWWVAHGSYPRGRDIVVLKCGNPHCVATDHLEARPRRRLSVAQVAEARRLFWAPWTRVGKSERKHKPPTPEQLTAWELGISLPTVQQVVAGARVKPSMWRGHADSTHAVLAVVEAKKEVARQKEEDHAKVCSQEALAKRFGLALASMNALLHGITYADVPMPPEADAKVQWEAQAAYAAQLEASRRNAVDPVDTSAIIKKDENHSRPTGTPAQDVPQRSDLAGYAAIHV